MTIEVTITHNHPAYPKSIVVNVGGKDVAVGPGDSITQTVWLGQQINVREAGDKFFRFALRQVVKISETGETGTVHARSESTSSEPQYLVRYKAADGRATEQWWSENALEAF